MLCRRRVHRRQLPRMQRPAPLPPQRRPRRLLGHRRRRRSTRATAIKARRRLLVQPVQRRRVRVLRRVPALAVRPARAAADSETKEKMEKEKEEEEETKEMKEEETLPATPTPGAALVDACVATAVTRLHMAHVAKMKALAVRARRTVEQQAATQDAIAAVDDDGFITL